MKIGNENHTKLGIQERKLGIVLNVCLSTFVCLDVLFFLFFFGVVLTQYSSCWLS